MTTNTAHTITTTSIRDALCGYNIPLDVVNFLFNQQHEYRTLTDEIVCKSERVAAYAQKVADDIGHTYCSTGSMAQIVTDLDRSCAARAAVVANIVATNTMLRQMYGFDQWFNLATDLNVAW